MMPRRVSPWWLRLLALVALTLTVPARADNALSCSYTMLKAT
jgi:hypothetical protein